jgi:hypothetical protein
MAIVLIIVAVLLIIVGVRGTGAQLLTLMKGDFTGKNNFGLWILALLIVGAVGYVPSLKRLSDMFIVLVIVGIIFANDKGTSGGFFTKFQSAIQNA